jgi:hypothetical protein
MLVGCNKNITFSNTINLQYFENYHKRSKRNDYLVYNRKLALIYYKDSILNIDNIVFFEFMLNHSQNYYAIFIENNKQYTYEGGITKQFNPMGVFKLGDKINEFDNNQIAVIIESIKKQKITELIALSKEQYHKISNPHLIIVTYWDKSKSKYITFNLMQFLFY